MLHSLVWTHKIRTRTVHSMALFICVEKYTQVSLAKREIGVDKKKNWFRNMSSTNCYTTLRHEVFCTKVLVILIQRAHHWDYKNKRTIVDNLDVWSNRCSTCFDLFFNRKCLILMSGKNYIYANMTVVTLCGHQFIWAFALCFSIAIRIKILWVFPFTFRFFRYRLILVVVLCKH